MRLININSGKNQKLLESCATLKEYSWFVEKVRKNMTSNMALEDAVDSAINDMPKDYQIRKFLIKNRAEVKNMCLTEYDQAETMRLFKEEGREEGIKEGRIEDVKNLMKNLKMSAKQVLSSLGIPESEHGKYMKML
ncbi:MAG: hypothetical protein IKR70_04150 [Lachnospiraceae bacterium]|nr:hypothetical protein [Lachnospiraceae bacterium]